MLESTWPEVIAQAYEEDALAKEWSAKGGRLGKVRHVSWMEEASKEVSTWRYKQSRMYIPESLRLEVMQKFHDSPWGGHCGSATMYKMLKKEAYWPSMEQDVNAYVRSCYSCQKTRPIYRAKGGLLHPLPIPKAPWEDIHMDFIVGLPESNGFDSILAIVDRFFQNGHICAYYEGGDGAGNSKVGLQVCLQVMGDAPNYNK